MHAPVNILDSNLVAALEGGERLCSPVGDDVTADTVDVQFAADRADLHTEFVGDLHGLQLLAGVNNALRQGVL